MIGILNSARVYCHHDKKTNTYCARAVMIDLPHLKFFGGMWHVHQLRSIGGSGATMREALNDWRRNNQFIDRPRC